MKQKKQSIFKSMTAKAVKAASLLKVMKAPAASGLALMLFAAVPAAVNADNSAMNNRAYPGPMSAQQSFSFMTGQAPEYRFETTFPYNQWGRPTTSNRAPQHTQNIRRDRHASVLPPSHGVNTGFFSGEFATNPANPFAPRYNNNPNAGRAVATEEPPFAVRPGEPGINVRPDGSHAGGFLASTSVAQGGGSHVGSNAPQVGPVSIPGTSAPWTNPGNQANIPGHADGGQGGFTLTHRPIEPTNSPQTPGQQNRVTTVTPFEDGTIGRITIPALNNRTASVRPGVALSTLDNYVGHFPYTSQWDGLVALASHNRGRGSFFAGIWNLQTGDRIIYETTAGVRVYKVISIEQISEKDLSNLDHTHTNTLNLITCVNDRPELRWSIRAVMV